MHQDNKTQITLSAIGLACWLSAAPALALEYTIIGTGTLPGDDSSIAFGLNNLGRVVGTSRAIGEAGTATLWSAAGGVIGLGTLGGSPSFAWALDVNDAGSVVGQSRGTIPPNDYAHAFVWNSTLGMLDLGVFAGDNTSTAYGINASGQVVGVSSLAPPFGSPSSSFDDWVDHAFLWTQATGMTALAALPGHAVNGASAINDAGQIAGSSGSGDFERAVRWAPDGSIQDFGTLPGYVASGALGMNGLGHVVGDAYDVGGYSQAFIWTPGAGMTGLGMLPGHLNSSAWSVNDSGQVLGVAWGNPGGVLSIVPFLWTASDGMVDLNSLLPAGSGWILGIPGAINDLGQVAGQGTFGGAFAGQGYLMTPTTVPLPGAFWLAIAGISGLLCVGRRCR